MNEYSIQGICSDMCPSSERKFRIKNNLVSSFECSKGRPDESRMLKQYRRSAANQDIKPVELRTIDALCRSMDHIIFDIIDKFDKNNSKQKRIWYDFIWDRMRAIRKDITVQRLIGERAIEILEKCARFHILCSSVLCEEQPDVFDFKINEQNLVDCVDKLRELYSIENMNRMMVQSDYRSNLNNQCEFLCYYIISNLDKENLIQEISLIDGELKRSNDLKFAIKVFIAYKTCNYYAFNQLFLDSTLLQACILNRYLNKIRLNAFCLLQKAVTVGQKPVFVPQTYFTKQLCIRQNELINFCKLINCELNDDQVIFVKNRLLKEDANFKLNRNPLIDFKLDELKISQIIIGSQSKSSNRVSFDQLQSLFEKVDYFNFS